MDRLTLIKNRLWMYLEAERKILNSQSYTIGERTLTRADLSKVQKQIRELTDEMNMLENGRGNVRRVVL